MNQVELRIRAIAEELEQQRLWAMTRCTHLQADLAVARESLGVASGEVGNLTKQLEERTKELEELRLQVNAGVQ